MGHGQHLLAPGRRLARYFLRRLGLGQRLRVGQRLQGQFRACFKAVDVLARKCVGVGSQQGQHQLFGAVITGWNLGHDLACSLALLHHELAPLGSAGLGAWAFAWFHHHHCGGSWRDMGFRCRRCRMRLLAFGWNVGWHCRDRLWAYCFGRYRAHYRRGVAGRSGRRINKQGQRADHLARAPAHSQQNLYDRLVERILAINAYDRLAGAALLHRKLQILQCRRVFQIGRGVGLCVGQRGLEGLRLGIAGNGHLDFGM